VILGMVLDPSVDVFTSLGGAGTFILGGATLYQVIKGNKKTDKVHEQVNGNLHQLERRNNQLVKTLSDNGVKIPEVETED
jgi:hypothetical protein